MSIDVSDYSNLLLTHSTRTKIRPSSSKKWVENEWKNIIIHTSSIFLFSSKIFNFYKIVETILDLTSGGELFRVYDLRSEFVTSALLNASSNHGEGTPETKRKSLNSPNRIQILEERTIKLTKSDTINPLTSSTRNCSPNFVKRVRMYVYLASSNDWNILEYRRIAGTLSITLLIWLCNIRNGYWIIDLYLKSLNFEIIEKVENVYSIKNDLERTGNRASK